MVNRNVANLSEVDLSVRYSRVHGNLVLSVSGLQSRTQVNGFLLTARGQVVRTFKGSSDNEGKLVMTSTSFPRGIYVLKLNCGGVLNSKRCVIW